MKRTDFPENFLESSFYKEYEEKNPYVIDKVMKELAKSEQVEEVRALQLPDQSYDSVVNFNIQVMNDLITKYINKKFVDDIDLINEIVKAVHVNPDSYAQEEINGVVCKLNDIVSIEEILKYHRVLWIEAIRDYEIFQKHPLFYFPSEEGGISTLRADVFLNRPDYLFFDIKNYFEGSDSCKLQSAYDKPKTKEWLSQFESFEEFTEVYDPFGLFVSGDGRVWDIQKGGRHTITSYKKDRSEYRWTYRYYERLREIMISYNEDYEKVYIQ